MRIKKWEIYAVMMLWRRSTRKCGLALQAGKWNNIMKFKQCWHKYMNKNFIEVVRSKLDLSGWLRVLWGQFQTETISWGLSGLTARHLILRSHGTSWLLKTLRQYHDVLRADSRSNGLNSYQLLAKWSCINYLPLWAPVSSFVKWV